MTATRTPAVLPLEHRADAVIKRALATPIVPPVPDFVGWARRWQDNTDQTFASATAMHSAVSDLLEWARQAEAATLAACRAASARKNVGR